MEAPWTSANPNDTTVPCPKISKYIIRAVQPQFMDFVGTTTPSKIKYKT